MFAALQRLWWLQTTHELIPSHFSSFEVISFCCVSSFLLCVLRAGWQILGQAQEEQLGCQTVPGCEAAQREPDRHPSRLPGEGELCPEAGGGRPEERARAHQEHPGRVRGAARAAVRTHTEDDDLPAPPHTKNTHTQTHTPITHTARLTAGTTNSVQRTNQITASF